MLWFNLDVFEYFQFNAELFLKDVKYLGCVLNLRLSQPYLVLIVCLFTLSEAYLIIFQDSIKLLSHVVLQTVIISGSDTFSQEVVL